MRRSLQSDQISSPEQVLYRMVQDYVQGNLSDSRVLFRAIVTQIDQQGGQIELDPPNPRNTIRARIITDSYNATTLDDDLPIFWPMFPHLQLPVKEDEMVYVMFEDDGKTHGLWLARTPQQLDVDSKNYTKATTAYEQNPLNDLRSISVDRAVSNTSDDPNPVTVSQDFTTEDVPEFTARVGDHVIHGSNNTIIVLGRDRPSGVDSGESQEAGTIDIVTGRQSPDDMSDTDLSRIYLSSKSDIDTNMSVGQIGAPGVAGLGPVATIGIKSDEIRVVARNGMKIVVTGGDLVLEGTNIVIGNQATEHAVLGDKYKTLLEKILQALLSHTHPTPAGPSGPSLDAVTDWTSAKETDLPQTLSQTVVVKG